MEIHFVLYNTKYANSTVARAELSGWLALVAQFKVIL